MNPHDGSVLRKSGEIVRWGVQTAGEFERSRQQMKQERTSQVLGREEGPSDGDEGWGQGKGSREGEDAQNAVWKKWDCSKFPNSWASTILFLVSPSGTVDAISVGENLWWGNSIGVREMIGNLVGRY